MLTATEKLINQFESELNFIGRHVQTIEGGGGHDFEAVDEIAMSVEAAKRMLFELRLELQPANEEIPADVPLPEAA